MSKGKSNKGKKKKEKLPLTICEASKEMIEKTAAEGIKTVFKRAQEMEPCPIGAGGSCCGSCFMGPCRLSEPQEEKEAEEKNRVGVCGATSETVAARNLVRGIAGGASAHSDHGRRVAEIFLKAAKGEIPDYEIKDQQKLYALAMDFGIDIENVRTEQIAVTVGELSLAEWGKQAGELVMARRAPLKRQEIWRKHNIFPRGIDREIVEAMHRTHMGVDQEYKNLLSQGTRVAISDGWGGAMLATELQDILLGTPVPVRGAFNLGVLKDDEVNIIIHGHDPLLSEMIILAGQDSELRKLAVSQGAKGINLAGLCCGGNEMLMRHGIPIAGNFLQQELVITTGVVDAMIVEGGGVMPSIVDIAQRYHTDIITTNPHAKISGAKHLEFNVYDARNSAKEIVRAAIENYPNRSKKANIPNRTSDGIAGFSHETIAYLLGGMFRASYRPLNDNIIGGRIRGIAGVVGGNNVRTTHDRWHGELVKELIKNDVLVLTTGCAAIACGKQGLLLPESAATHAGSGLAEVCETLGIPPVLHMGSCVDNSRILLAATAVVKEGGLGDDISDLPLAGAAPEAMSEEDLSIGQCFVASGIYTVLGGGFPAGGSDSLATFLFKELEEAFGGMWDCAGDPTEMAGKMIAHIDKKRKALGIDKARERILYDMAMRRELDAM